MTLPEYITAVNALFSPPLSKTEERWAAHAWNSGDIPPQRFAGWLALTSQASSPPLPQGSLPTVEKEKPPPGRMKRAGRGKE